MPHLLLHVRPSILLFAQSTDTAQHSLPTHKGTQPCPASKQVPEGQRTVVPLLPDCGAG